MKAAVVAGLLGAVAVSATPTRTDREPPTKRQSLPAVSVSGNAFWANGERFYVRGIDYQPGGAAAELDPLSDSTICLRDIEKFKDLGVNSVRVYMVNNSAGHDECMNALAEAGIYLLLDVNNPKYSINRADPFPSYNTAYLQSVFATIDAFAKYDNTLLFFSGNEVINDEDGTSKTAPFLKAITRDMKNYMKARKYRAIPVGYSAADVSDNRLQTAEYMNCGADDLRSDFFAFNDYSWCNSDFKTSGWDEKVKNFTDYGLPIFLSEWGCIENGERKFGELEALMSPDMTGVYSGGLMYEYSLEENNYGIVKISDDGKLEELSEYAGFKSALSQWPAPTGAAGAASTTHAAASCPTSDSLWEVDPTKVPAMPTQAKAMFDGGAGEAPGLKGGSQTATDSGTSPDDVSANENGSGGVDVGDSGDSAVTRFGDKTWMVTATAFVFALGGTLAL